MKGLWRLVPTLAALLLIALFVTLGVWQLHRAAEKRELQAEYDRRASQAPVRLGPEVQALASLQYFRVQARGTYDTDYQLLLDNRVHQGTPGYHVLTPLRLEGGDTRVLVNRGWIPLGADRSQLPVVSPPAGLVTVVGVATVPRDGLVLADPPALSRERPTVWAHFDLVRYARSVPHPLQPVVILLDASSDAGGYVRQWTRLDAGIAVHQGYAFQWFALAAALLVIVIVFAVRARRRGVS